MSTQTAKNRGSKRPSGKPTRPSQAKPSNPKPSMATTPQLDNQLTQQFRELRLPMFREHFQSSAQRAVTENLSHTDYLAELTQLRTERRLAAL